MNINAAIIVPADLATGPRAYAPAPRMALLVASWLAAIRHWIICESFDGETMVGFHWNTLRILNAPAFSTLGGAFLNPADADDPRVSLDSTFEGRIWELLGHAYPRVAAGKPHRTWALVVGAQGWYGGRHDQENRGGAIVGDALLRAVLTGKTPATQAPLGEGHELLHALGMDHADMPSSNISTGEPFNDKCRQILRAFNADFMRPI